MGGMQGEAPLLVAPLWRRGWLLLGLILANVVLITLWHIARDSEAQSVKSTLEHLERSLGSLAAENMARGRPLAARWASGNPFVQLHWQPADYCGELFAGDEPRRGCWYFQPEQARLLYRERFGEVRRWQLLGLPLAQPGLAAAPLTAVELRPLAAGEP